MRQALPTAIFVKVFWTVANGSYVTVRRTVCFALQYKVRIARIVRTFVAFTDRSTSICSNHQRTVQAGHGGRSSACNTTMRIHVVGVCATLVIVPNRYRNFRAPCRPTPTTVLVEIFTNVIVIVRIFLKTQLCDRSRSRAYQGNFTLLQRYVVAVHLVRNVHVFLRTGIRIG